MERSLPTQKPPQMLTEELVFQPGVRNPVGLVKKRVSILTVVLVFQGAHFAQLGVSQGTSGTILWIGSWMSAEFPNRALGQNDDSCVLRKFPLYLRGSR